MIKMSKTASKKPTVIKSLNTTKRLGDILKDSTFWVKGALAYDEDHCDEVDPWSPEARTFCLLGAAHRLTQVREEINQALRVKYEKFIFDAIKEMYPDKFKEKHEIALDNSKYILTNMSNPEIKDKAYYNQENYDKCVRQDTITGFNDDDAVTWAMTEAVIAKADEYIAADRKKFAGR